MWYVQKRDCSSMIFNCACSKLNLLQWESKFDLTSTRIPSEKAAFISILWYYDVFCFRFATSCFIRLRKLKVLKTFRDTRLLFFYFLCSKVNFSETLFCVNSLCPNAQLLITIFMFGFVYFRFHRDFSFHGSKLALSPFLFHFHCKLFKSMFFFFGKKYCSFRNYSAVFIFMICIVTSHAVRK